MFSLAETAVIETVNEYRINVLSQTLVSDDVTRPRGSVERARFLPQPRSVGRGKSKKEENNIILQEINSFFESGAIRIPIHRPATLGQSVTIFFSGLIFNV
jgi:hypothetical protein